MEISFPTAVHWEITYACPLRCVHCYSESGRRSSRQLDTGGMLRLAARLAAMRETGLRTVVISGGEPLLVEELPNIVGKLQTAGLMVLLHTSGHGITAKMAEKLCGLSAVHVSLDGAKRETHDRIRGRAGAFQQALQALTLLQFNRQNGSGLRFGIDTVLTRSNFSEIPELLQQIVPQFPSMDFVSFGAVVPLGLASRESYEEELLTEEQVAMLSNQEFITRMKSLVPSGVPLRFTDNVFLRLKREQRRLPLLTVEPDGNVRGLVAYESSTGNILTDDPRDLWRATCELRSHPYLEEQLQRVTTMKAWAAATRNLDKFFGSQDDLIRISRRAAFVP